MKTDFPTYGKIGPQLFEEVVRPRLGALRPEVIVGPRHGCDNAVVRIDGTKIMVVTTDPLTVIPALGIEDSAWLSVHLIASDLATSGLMPQYAVFDLNLPPSMTREEFERYWSAVHEECSRLGIAIIAGHTGKFFGCDYTIVGGGMMIAVGEESSYVSPTTARPGDHVIVTKGAAIGSTGILARVFPETVKARYGEELQQRAAGYFKHYSVVDDAMAAVTAGVRENGVTAMHDATEGGVLGALHELASAAGCGIRVRQSAIPVSYETRMICDLFGIDPSISLSEGALLIAVKPEKAEKVADALRDAGITTADVAELLPAENGCWVETGTGNRPLRPVEVDPYWQAFADAMAKGWK